MMKKYIEQELRCGIYCRSYYIILAILCLLFGLTIFFNYESVTDTYNNYKNTVNYYEKQGLDIQKYLTGDYKVESNGDSKVITNPILYHKNNLSKYAYAASPKYTLSQLLESSTLYFPLVFGMLGLIVGTNDFKYKTIKLKTIRMDKKNLGIAKQLSIAFSIFFILIAALIISYIAGWIMYSKLCSRIPVEQFNMSAINTSSPIITKFIFGYIIALVFAEIGYTLGIIFKNMIVGAISIALYMFALPNLGMFDLKNCIFYFAKKVFDYYGVISVQSPKETSTMVSVSIILLVVIAFVTTNIVVVEKRSSFEG